MSNPTTPKSVALAVAELEAIAGDELRDVLDAMRGGERLTLDQADRLDVYLRSERQAGGLLTREHLIASGVQAPEATRLVRSVRALVRWIDLGA